VRDVILAALLGDATLAGLGVSDGAVLTGDVDTPTERPFLQLRYGPTTPGPARGGVGPNMRDLTIWVHDVPNDYTRIDKIIQQIKVVMLALEAEQSALTDGWLVVVEWVGDSDDLADDGHRTITRNTSYRIVGSSL
jgi:hypothetical protein